MAASVEELGEASGISECPLLTDISTQRNRDAGARPKIARGQQRATRKKDVTGLSSSIGEKDKADVSDHGANVYAMPPSWPMHVESRGAATPR